VHVGGDGAADREAIGARLLLHDSPRPWPARLSAHEIVDELRPLRARLHRHQAALGVEGEDAIHRTGVDEQRPFAELLAAHRVPPARDADGRALLARTAHQLRQRLVMRGLRDRAHRRRVELGMHVVDDDGRGAPRRGRASGHTGHGGRAQQQAATRQHGDLGLESQRAAR
jgi:hypothetical protein